MDLVAVAALALALPVALAASVYCLGHAMALSLEKRSLAETHSPGGRFQAAAEPQLDIKNARTLFLRLKPGDRRTVLTMLDE
jgi:hypothetical protein